MHGADEVAIAGTARAGAGSIGVHQPAGDPLRPQIGAKAGGQRGIGLHVDDGEGGGAPAASVDGAGADRPATARLQRGRDPRRERQGVGQTAHGVAIGRPRAPLQIRHRARAEAGALGQLLLREPAASRCCLSSSLKAVPCAVAIGRPCTDHPAMSRGAVRTAIIACRRRGNGNGSQHANFSARSATVRGTFRASVRDGAPPRPRLESKARAEVYDAAREGRCSHDTNGGQAPGAPGA